MLGTRFPLSGGARSASVRPATLSPSARPHGRSRLTTLPRRQSALAPGTPFVLPPGIPLAYDARLALGRLWQLYRRIIQAPSLPDGFRWRSDPMPQAVRDLAADCGLTVGANPGRVVLRCPRCRRDVYVLRAIGDDWACRRCDRQRWSQIEVSAATYAMGIRIGYRGRPMREATNRQVLGTTRAGDRGRTGDLVLGKRSRPVHPPIRHHPMRERSSPNARPGATGMG